MRQAAIGTGACAALVFVLLAAGWISGLVLVALGAGAMALFVGALRLVSRLLDIDGDTARDGTRHGAVLAAPGLRVARRTLPQRPRPAIRAI